MFCVLDDLQKPKRVYDGSAPGVHSSNIYNDMSLSGRTKLYCTLRINRTTTATYPGFLVRGGKTGLRGGMHFHCSLGGRLFALTTSFALHHDPLSVSAPVF